MKFSEYVDVIKKSVAQSGYSSFHPSACIPGVFKNQFHVLEGELREEGEESVAVAWAKTLKKSGKIFLAFRAGDRRVTVVELKDGEVADGLVIQVNPYTEVSG
jgi:hypothetical protein